MASPRPELRRSTVATTLLTIPAPLVYLHTIYNYNHERTRLTRTCALSINTTSRLHPTPTRDPPWTTTIIRSSTTHSPAPPPPRNLPPPHPRQHQLVRQHHGIPHLEPTRIITTLRQNSQLLRHPARKIRTTTTTSSIDTPMPPRRSPLPHRLLQQTR